jgi:uncharacterized protein with GYD domain
MMLWPGTRSGRQCSGSLSILLLRVIAQTPLRPGSHNRSRYTERHVRGSPERRIIGWFFAQNNQHDVEVAMKYVLLGNLSPEWASKQSERIGKAKAKLDKLGIKIESIHYTQGYYDFVDIVDAPKPEAMLAFSIWYSTQGLGRIQSMPAFDAKSFETAIKDAAG